MSDRSVPICELCGSPLKRNAKRWCSRSCFIKACTTPLEDRFWRRVQKSDEGCWVWIGSGTKNGYGTIARGSHPNMPVLVHRVSWQIHFGDIPEGLQVLHRCDHRRCVRPDHLFLGTNADNQADMDAKNRRVFPPKILTIEQVRQIRRRVASGDRQIDIALDFGISKGTVSDIKCGKSWSRFT